MVDMTTGHRNRLRIRLEQPASRFSGTGHHIVECHRAERFDEAAEARDAPRETG
jgi:hypothetical protein